MRKILALLFGAAVMASPVAPQGCATVGVGITVHGERGDYSLVRTHEDGKPARYDVLVGIDGKRITPFEK